MDINKMDLTQNLSKIENHLHDNELEKALDLTRDLKSNNNIKDGEKSLLDYYMGQALLRMHSRDNSHDAKKLTKSIDYLKKSLQNNDNFSDGHILLGFANMRYSSLFSSHKIRKKAIYHLNRAKELDSSLEIECNKNLEILIEPKLIICNPNKNNLEEYKKEFENYPNVEIITGNILRQKCDAIVSPANSFGFMDGGLDYKLSQHFGWDLEKKLQKNIRDNHLGELLVGNAEIIETGNKKIPYLISAPTMRVPQTLDLNSVNAYLSTKAALMAIEKLNEDAKIHIEKKIKTVSFPFMCTGVGEMPYSTSARQMRNAYDEIILGKLEFPKDFGEAQEKNAILYSDEYGKFLAKIKYHD